MLPSLILLGTGSFKLNGPRLRAVETTSCRGVFKAALECRNVKTADDYDDN